MSLAFAFILGLGGQSAVPVQTGAPSAAPGSLAAAVSATIGGERPEFAVGPRNEVPVARGGGLETRFGSHGPVVRALGGRLQLRLHAIGRGGDLARVGPVVPVTTGNRVSYRRGALDEWYVNGPLGLEQGFTLRQRPVGVGPLTLAVQAAGRLRPHRAGAAILFDDAAGKTVARYGGLFALDAAGRHVPAQLELSGRTLLLRVEDAGARYPLTIDPFIQKGGKLTGGGATPGAEFGWSVSLSADGTTALVGGDGDSKFKGAAWVFKRSGAKWVQQGGKLTGAGEVGPGRFGESVELSADGSTALIGGYFDNNGKGAAWVFTRSGSGWKQQGPKLTSRGIGNGRFGIGVALSGSGNVALIGAYTDNIDVGAAWTFTRAGGKWRRQGGKLTARGEIGSGQFGEDVALSSSGTTALISARLDNDGVGAAWVYTRAGSRWRQQSRKLTGAGEKGSGRFGQSVALSSDGSTALIGGYRDNGSKGAAWAFKRTGATWNQQGGKLTSNDEAGKPHFGYYVALSAKGSTALIGGYSDNGDIGAAWTFTRAGSAWKQQGGKLTGRGESGNGRFGISVALSANAKTAMVGGSEDDGGVGAAWTFGS